MEIAHKDDGKRGKFYIEKDGTQQAEMTYVWSGNDRIIIDHTEVGDALRGTGAGKQLVVKAVEFARQKGIKILPLCPFAKAVIEKDTSLQDIL